MIDVKDLRKSFGNNEVLCGITEHIDKGEKVVVIGPSGSGKSTFLRCLNLLEMPTSGEILFKGVSMTDPATDINLMRRSMGMVFQHFNLFNNLSIMDNMTLAPVQLKLKTKKEAVDEAMELLGRVGSAGQGWRIPFAALRRTEAEDRDRKVSGHASGSYAVRRTDIRARS